MVFFASVRPIQARQFDARTTVHYCVSIHGIDFTRLRAYAPPSHLRRASIECSAPVALHVSCCGQPIQYTCVIYALQTSMGAFQ